MKTLYPSDIPEFLRQFRFNAVRLRRLRFQMNSQGDMTADAHVIVKKQSSTLNTTGATVILHLHMIGVEEYRFQKRPGDDRSRKSIGRVGSFQGTIFIDFDAYSLGTGEMAKAHDYRASDAFVACRDLQYTIVEKASKPV
jgi:hypothetical protein